jgi:hypothetical protein
VLCHRSAGDGLVVSASGPGIFLQGLAVHGPSGAPLPGAALDPGVVAAAFEYAERMGVPLCAFLGDTCATLRMAPELEVLTVAHHAGFPTRRSHIACANGNCWGEEAAVPVCQRWTASLADPPSLQGYAHDLHSWFLDAIAWLHRS